MRQQGQGVGSLRSPDTVGNFVLEYSRDNILWEDLCWLGHAKPPLSPTLKLVGLGDLKGLSRGSFKHYIFLKMV